MAFYDTDDPREKWNLIHKFGVTKKSQKRQKFVVQDTNIDADCLNKEFLKILPRDKVEITFERPSTTFCFKNVTPAMVLAMIKSVKSNGMGPDKIPPKCIKAMAEYLAAPMAHLINTSFHTSTFPDMLKHISITPIPKVENPTQPGQFRPICSANFFLKVFSKITCEQMYNYLENNKILDDRRLSDIIGRVQPLFYVYRKISTNHYRRANALLLFYLTLQMPMARLTI